MLHSLLLKARAEIFRLLLGDQGKELHLRDIARQSDMAAGALQKELQRLEELKLIVSTSEPMIPTLFIPSFAASSKRPADLPTCSPKRSRESTESNLPTSLDLPRTVKLRLQATSTSLRSSALACAC